MAGSSCSLIGGLNGGDTIPYDFVSGALFDLMAKSKVFKGLTFGGGLAARRFGMLACPAIGLLSPHFSP